MGHHASERVESARDVTATTYGLRFCGAETMEPEFRDGDTLLVDPAAPLRPGDTVALYAAAPDQPGTAVTIKVLVDFTATHWRLRQHNPPLEWIEARADWPVCHRVVGVFHPIEPKGC